MRRTLWLLLVGPVMAGCGPDSDPIDVAERFHEYRVDEDDPAVYALLTEADRAALPLEAFPTGLPTAVMSDVMGWGMAPVESATVLRAEEDTAAVLLNIAGGQQDTVWLRATHDPISLGLFEIDRVRWRVSMGLAELALLDSLATVMREDPRPSDPSTKERAEAYLAAATQHPQQARPADVDAAKSLVRMATVADALQVRLRLSRSISGVPFVEGQVENPTQRRINTLVLAVTDATGTEEEFEVWDIAPGDATQVRWISSLRRGPLTHQVASLHVF
jgi:hypothetical protein